MHGLYDSRMIASRLVGSASQLSSFSVAGS